MVLNTARPFPQEVSLGRRSQTAQNDVAPFMGARSCSQAMASGGLQLGENAYNAISTYNRSGGRRVDSSAAKNASSYVRPGKASCLLISVYDARLEVDVSSKTIIISHFI